MRYGGNYKSRGPQYVRGIQEGNGIPKDSDMWVSYSMNKEDILSLIHIYLRSQEGARNTVPMDGIPTIDEPQAVGCRLVERG